MNLFEKFVNEVGLFKTKDDMEFENIIYAKKDDEELWVISFWRDLEQKVKWLTVNRANGYTFMVNVEDKAPELYDVDYYDVFYKEVIL